MPTDESHVKEGHKVKGRVLVRTPSGNFLRVPPTRKITATYLQRYLSDTTSSWTKGNAYDIEAAGATVAKIGIPEESPDFSVRAKPNPPISQKQNANSQSTLHIKSTPLNPGDRRSMREKYSLNPETTSKIGVNTRRGFYRIKTISLGGQPLREEHKNLITRRVTHKYPQGVRPVSSLRGLRRSGSESSLDTIHSTQSR